MRKPEPDDAPTHEGTIPLSVPALGGREWLYVKECLDTNWVSSVGPFVDRFERMVAEYLGARHAVAAVNGTAALHIALLVAGIQPDDEVLMSTLTFIAPANAVRYVGAWPVFIDAEPDFWQIDPQKIHDFLTEGCVSRRGVIINKVSRRRIRAILPVHILGHPCNMDPILDIARRYGLVLIEDASEGLGSRFRGKAVGRVGDIAALSFNGNKIITTGGGGMVVTDNAEWGDRARYLMTQAKDHPIEYVHGEVGYNYRLTNIQAALGVAQMERLDQHVDAKRRIAATYAARLGDARGVTPMPEAPWAFSTYWLYTALVHEGQYGMSSRQLLGRLAQVGIQSRPLWQPIHMSRAHRGSQSYRCEVAPRLYRDALSLPCSVSLSPLDQERVARAVRDPA